MREICKSEIFGVYLFGLRGSVTEVSLILTSEVGEVIEADCGSNLAYAVACIAEHCLSGRATNVVEVIDNRKACAKIEATAEIVYRYCKLLGDLGGSDILSVVEMNVFHSSLRYASCGGNVLLGCSLFCGFVVSEKVNEELDKVSLCHTESEFSDVV